MEVKVYKSITEIPEPDWDSIVGRNRIICTHRFLEAVEKSNINDCKYYYPVVYDNNKIIAHACAYSISMELDIFAEGITKKIINVIRKVWKNFLIIKLFECGTPIALGNTISFADQIDKKQYLPFIIKAIEVIAKEKKISIILLRDFNNNELFFFDNLINLGYGRTFNLPTALLQIKWDTFEDYLKSMRKHYRQNIRANKKKFKDSGIEVQLINSFSQYSVEFTKLWKNLFDNAKEYRREILTPAFFENMDKYLGQQSMTLVLKKDDRLIAYILLLFNNNILVPLFAGLDHLMNKQYKLYFNLFYNVIEIGIREKMKYIDFGITTLEPKKQIGCEITNLYMYMKHLNPIINILMNKIFNIFTPKVRLLCKKVFRLS
ncbi:MAG: GNAT family N-acetyltransferase [Spirochaetota bacterium]